MKNTTMNRFGLKKSTSTSLSREAQRQRRRLALRKQLVFESLESRHLMAGDLGTFLTQGHVDIDIARSGIEWSVGVNNAESVPETRYANNDAVLYVGATSLIERPDIAQFDFIGVNPGEQFYLLPQNEDPNMLFLGVSAEAVDASTVDRYSPASESKGRVSTVGRWVKAALSDVRHTNPDGSVGTGIFSSWRTGTFGQTTVFMSSLNDGVSNPNGSGLDVTDGISADDAVWIQAGTESHLNFGFSKPGRYEVDLRVSAYFGDDTLSTPNIAGLSTSTPVTLFFSVASSGELQFESATYSVNENAGTASVDVIRVGGSVGKLTVDYATSNGSAIAGSDFTSTIGTLTFGDKETRKTIVIPIIHDATLEPTEAFSLALTSPKPADFHSYRQNIEGDVNGLLGGIATATVSIVNVVNSAPTISDISNQFVIENKSTAPIAFTVGDGETPAANLAVTATSSNTALVPNTNVVLGGSGANRTVTMTPLANQVGITTITVTVTDASGQQTSDTFVLRVTSDGLVPFAETVGYPGVIATRSNTLVSADFNGDGKLDLVSVGGLADSIALLKGNGDATFQAEVQVNAGSGFYVGRMFAVDYDRDGDMDLLNGEFDLATIQGAATNGQVAVHLNNGNGTFTRQMLFGGFTQAGSFILTADLNGDGRPDMIRAANDTTLVYHESLSTGGYAPQETISSSFTALSVANYRLDDIDADGDIDILAYDSSPRVLSIFRNDGAGNFGSAQQLTFAAATTIRAVADINGDSRPDIVATNTTSVYYPQLPDGSFGSQVSLGFSGSGGNTTTADLNQDGVVDLIVNQNPNVLWASGRGGGTFGPLQTLQSNIFVANTVLARDFDGDGDVDIVVGSSASGTPVKVSKNLTGENPMRFTPPATRTYLSGDPLEMRVSFGFPIAVTGTPRIALHLGSNVVYANYVSGTGTQTLLFRYVVSASDVDLDGVQLVTNSIDLNGGTLINPEGGAAVLEFPATTLSGVIVNAAGPLVQSITRLDPQTTNAATVRFQLTFSEAVTGVDASDLEVVMNAGNLAGAGVVSITGSGSVYEVTVGTGTGSGTLGLSVKGTASIFDLNGDILAKGYFGGQVYTVRKEPVEDIEAYYVQGHADYRPLYSSGAFDFVLRPDAGVLPNALYPSDDVITYLDSTALVTRPVAATYNFLGVAAGEQLYLSNSAGNIASVPYLGWSGESLPRGVFAGNPRLQLVGMRNNSGGQFSVYSVASGNPTIRMATSDGISSADSFAVSVGSHSHYNVAFSKAGTYEVDLIVTGFLDSNGNATFDAGKDEYIESGIKTIVFHVDSLGARNDAFEVSGKDALRGSVTLNDDWNDGLGVYTASVQTTTTKGTLSLQPNGSFTYQPSATFDGSDSFTYRLTNPRGGFTAATVTITGSVRPDFEAVLKTGHADIGVNFEDDAWDLHIHDHEPDTEYEPDEALFYVGRDAMLTRTGDAANAAYDFLGAPVGSTLFVLPQVENPNLLFLGIGGEELADGLLEGDKATLRLASVSGPGQFSIWQSGLTPTTPKLLMATSDGIDASDAFDVGAGSHAHANFAFTKQGFYEVTFVASGVNADGDATDSGPVTYHFYVSDGLAPFARPTEHGGTIATEAGPVVSADFTGDGKVDVVTAGFGAGSLSFLQGTGDGSFLPERGLNVGSAFRPWTLSAVDFDMDGKVDIVTTEFSTTTGEIVVYKNDGTGNFTRVVLASGLPLVSRSSAGDLNGDSRPDIVYFKNNTTLVFQRGNTSGGLDPESVVSSTFSSATSLVLADVNADGRLDIVAADATANRIRLFNQNSLGVFELSDEVVVASGVDLKQVVDLNGDGRLDLLTTDTDSASLNKAGYYSQMPSGLFGPRVNLPIYGQGVNSLRAADFNRDGVIDIAFGNLFFDEVAFSFFNFDVGWLPGQGTGAFGPSIFLKTYGSRTGDLIAPDLDGDLDPDIVIGGAQNAVDSETLYAFVNQSGENPMVLIPPAALTRTAGDPIDLQVYFGFPITVTGTPQIALQLGANTVYANYIGGTGTPTLRFRYTVTATDMDLDGVQLASNLIGLNGGTMKDPLNGNAVLEFPNVVFNGVLVNGAGPLVQGITRLDSRSTVAPTVRFEVTFSEPVTGVDATDFDVAMKEGNLSGANVQSVSGSGSTYQVTVATGTGSGTLGLNVKGTASIFDLNGDVLGKGFAGGQVYTVRREAIGDIDNFYTHRHADFRPTLNNGEFSWILNPDPGLIPGSPFPSEEVITYLDSTSIVTRPAAATYDFLGVPAGAPLYLSNSSGSLQTTVPYLGFSGESIAPGTFAAYNPADPRMSATPRDYMKVEMVGMRSSSGGDLSLYSVLFSGAVRVWMASSDGLSSTDNIWLRSAAHSHFNLAFSKPGVYEVDIVVSGYLDSNGNGVYNPVVDPYVESGIKTMVFHVDTFGARNDTFSLSVDGTLRGSVTLNDDWDNGIGAYTASVQTTTTKGALALQPNGSFTYQPSANFDGSDSFTYRLTNPRGGFTTATVTIAGSTRPDFDAVLRTGHADIGVNFEDDAWDLHIHDHEPDTEYKPDEALLYVGRDAMLTRTGNAADAAYDFLGAPVGSTLFVLPQVENPNLLFLGIGGEELADGLLDGDVATLRLASVSGPGHFSMWQAGLTPTTPKLLMATSDGIDASDAFDVGAGSHSHANFAFTKQGFYEVTFVASGVDADGNATDSGQVTYYFNVTDGLVPFAMPSFLDPNITSASASQLADLNGDGKLDLAIARAGGVGYILGVGDGSFSPVQYLPGSTGARNDMVAIDFDGDGDVDLLNSQANVTDTADILSLYRNDGTANFTRVELITSLLRSSSQVEAADLNGDGRLDVVYGRGNTGVAYAMQQANGTLGSEVILPVTLTTASVQVTDLDADGDTDIVVGNRTGANNGAITVFKNSGSGIFTATQTISTGNFPSVLKLTDMDGDGRVDIVSTQLIANTRVGWYPQLANGTFGTRVNVMTQVSQLNSLEVADINVDGVPDIVAGVTQLLNGTLSFVSVWSAGLGSGAFANPILLDPNQGNNSGMRVADLDGDSYPDIIATGNADSTRPSAVRVLINKTGEDPMVLVPPASRSHVVGDVIELSVYFGFPVTVTGTPRIALQLGANTVYANYLSGSATGTLKFRYAITTSDVDFDGVQLASNVINLNGGTITDPLGGNAVLTFPNLTFDGVIVNGAGPLVQGISRLDARATEAATVRFQIQFGEAVTGVDIGDFAVVMNAGDLAGASVVSVTGSSSLYEVTVSTGTGSGTLGLSVKGTANIFDLNGDILGKGFTGGEVYTVRREAIGDIDTFYTNAHADYRMTLNNGEFSWILRPDAGLLPNSSYPSEEVYTYLDSTAIVTRPTTANYDFLGVPSGAPLYLSNSSGNIASVPFLGFSGESILPGVFANYVPADPRITSTTPQGYMKVEMVGLRSSTGGDFSIYSIASGNPRVWMASSDGISSTDNIWSRWGSHTHFNTAFSKPGIYEVDVVISGFIDSNGNGTYDPIIDQYIESGIKTMVFNIDTLGARDDAFKVNSEEILRGSVTLNDDWDNGIGAYTASVQSTTTKGALALQPNGSFTYQPSATFDGSDSFTYRLTNPRGGFTSATVTITGSTRPDFDAVLRTGHADIGVNFEDDAWDLHIHDEETDTEYEPDEAMFYVGRDAMLTRTGDAANTAYDFLGAPVGSTLFVLSQVENPNLLFLGIGGEELADGLLEGDKATLRLASVSGPGQFSIWQSGLTPTTPKLLVATSDGIDTSDAFDVGAGSHAHANFAFTKQGFYEVTFVATGVDADGNATDSGQVTYYFNVSDGLVPFAMPVYQDPGVGPSGFQSQMADFNGDGKQDLIVAGSGGNALGYRQGIGDGSFMPEQLLNAGSGLSAQGIVAVDYDGDGDMDLVAQEYVQSVANTGTITLYRNNGTASFTRVLLASGHPESYRVVAGDLNGDGRTDLVYGKALSTVVYALQQPNGELAAETALPVTFGSAEGVLLGDIDNDNDLDIVVSNRANGVNAYFSVFSNNGSGVFSATQSKATGIFPVARQLVDMNGDGRLDVVTGESVAGSRAGYYPQLSDGTFGSRVVVLPTNTQLNSIRVADINGDGIPDIAAGAIVGGVFSMVWSPGLGGGAFGSTILIDPNQGNAFSIHIADLDGDHNPDMVTTGTRSETRPSAVRVYINKTGEDPMVLIPPAARTRVAGDPIELSVYFGFPITVAGTPRIALDLSGNTVYANYVSGSGTPTLNFRYTVTATDLDLDGVQLANNTIQLNGGTLTDPLGGAGVLEFPNVPFNGVIVNGRGPLVQSITRLDSQATTAGTVRFNVQFAEAVTGVDMTDFAVRMSSGDLAGAAVTSVTGSGNLYEVTVSTGTGSGTLGLSVLNSASIFDLSGDVLAKGYAGGEVYTVHPTPVGPIDTFYVQGHADYSVEYNNGDFSWYLDPDNGLLPENKYKSDEVITYLDSTAIVNRAAGANYDFLGVAANQPLYLSNSSGNIASVPFLGWGGDNLKANEFADRLTGDPRISGSTLREYVKVQMVGFRSDSGGDFSLYSVSSGNPTVWFATSDGIGSTDNIWLYRTHFHRNTAFSKPGRYEVDVVISGYLDGNANNALDASDVFVESGIKTMVFNVDTLGAVSDAFNVNGQEMLHGSVTLNDTWNDGLGEYAASIQATTTKGTLSLQPNGSFTYQPSPAFDGSDSFTYRLTNPRGGFTTATVSITGSTRPEFDAVLTKGHADIGVNFEDDAWDLHIHDEETDTEYEPSEALLRVGLDAKLTRTGNAADPAYDFLGVPVGSSLFVLPQVENPNLLFLGIGGEELATGLLAGNKASLRLASVSGPGQFSVWQSGLTPTTPKLIMATSDGIDAADSFDVAAGSHAHVNFAFTKLGFYEVTFVALGIDADGNETDSGQITYYFVVGNEVRELDVQNGLDQRSYIRNLDLVFESDEGLLDLLGTGRIQLTKFDLNGENGVAIANPTMGVVGNTLRFDFGSQGLGGNRNSNVGDGYYRIGIDVDGDGQMDAFKHFYRLLGDVTGDGKVDDLDRLFILKSVGSNNPNADVNGDRVVNGVDSLLATRAFGRKLKDGLRLDD